MFCQAEGNLSESSVSAHSQVCFVGELITLRHGIGTYTDMPNGLKGVFNNSNKQPLNFLYEH